MSFFPSNATVCYSYLPTPNCLQPFFSDFILMLNKIYHTLNSFGKPKPNRTLVPFASDSELWPYTQGLVQENCHSNPDEDGDDGDIVELNF
jgi:hypothetical protein